MALFSVIIPVYNTEKFLPKCINSLKEQSFKDFEVILVDDCSTDGSYDLCKKVSGEDDRFITIRQPENRRQSAARNIGLQKSKGKYVLFIDSDDYIECDLLEKVSEYIKSYDYDLLTWGMYYDTIKKSGEILITESPLNAKKFKTSSNPTAQDWESVILNTFFASPCNKLYRADIIKQNNLQFDEMCVDFEDFIFNINYARHAKNFAVLTESLYHYHIPEGQIAPLKRRWGLVPRFEVSRKVYDAVDNFVASLNDGSRHLNELMRYVYKAYNNEIEYSYRMKNRKEFKSDIKLLVNDTKYYKMLGCLSFGALKKVILPQKLLIKLKFKNLLALFMALIMNKNIKNNT